MTSPALELSGFGVTGPGPSDVIDSVTATVNAWTSDLGTGPLAYELHDGRTGALIGTQQAGQASGNSFHYDTVTFQAPAPAWAQLYWLQLWIYADQGTAPSGTVVSVDYASLSVAYEPSGQPFAAPVAGRRRGNRRGHQGWPGRHRRRHHRPGRGPGHADPRQLPGVDPHRHGQ